MNTSAISELSQLMRPSVHLAKNRHSEVKTLLLLVIVASCSFFNSYLTLFSATSLPGDKLFAGMMFGFAESSASFVSGVICSKVPDKYAMMASNVLFCVANCVFYFGCGGRFESLLSFIAVFCMTLGCGATVNIMYLVIEMRVPPAKLGSSIVAVITAAMFFTTFASTAAY